MDAAYSASSGIYGGAVIATSADVYVDAAIPASTGIYVNEGKEWIKEWKNKRMKE